MALGDVLVQHVVYLLTLDASGVGVVSLQLTHIVQAVATGCDIQAWQVLAYVVGKFHIRYCF